MSNAKYFLGCPTPAGFETHFGDYIKSGDFVTYILKGGPGTGKSTLMKRLAEGLSDLDEAELYYCSSDPDSLDAVLFRKLGIIMVDGTAPHVFEPIYPGARERIVDLGRFWNAAELRKSAAEIVALTDGNKKLHDRSKRYLGAVCSLNDDIMAAGEAAALNDKLDGFIVRLSAKLLPKSGRGRGEISLRQITSITPKGVMTQEAAFEGYEKYAVVDPYYAVCDRLLKGISAAAASAGYDVVASKNVFMSGCVYEHVAIPELRIALVSEETCSGESVSKINALRFYNRDMLRERRRRFLFDSSAKRELIFAAIEALSRAKSVHDELEEHYISAMDFKAIDALAKELIAKIKAEM